MPRRISTIMAIMMLLFIFLVLVGGSGVVSVGFFGGSFFGCLVGYIGMHVAEMGCWTYLVCACAVSG